MKSLKKCAALLTSAVMAASLVSCGSIKSALTFDGAGDTTYGVTIAPIAKMVNKIILMRKDIVFCNL